MSATTPSPVVPAPAAGPGPATDRRRTDRRTADRLIQTTAATAVAALATVTAAVSYTHMRTLADLHGETGWQGHAFPVSVDGIEAVAALVLLANRRAGHPSGPLVWTALAAGTTASMAANIAVGAADLIGRIISGWPAVALLLAIKLLARLIDHPPPVAPGPTRRPPSHHRPAGAPSRRMPRQRTAAGPGTDRPHRRSPTSPIFCRPPGQRTAH